MFVHYLLISLIMQRLKISSIIKTCFSIRYFIKHIYFFNNKLDNDLEFFTTIVRMKHEIIQ